MRLLYVSDGITVHDSRFLRAFCHWGWETFSFHLAVRENAKQLLPEGVTRLEWPQDPQNTGPLEAHVEPLRLLLRRVRPDVVYAGPIPSAGWLAARAQAAPLALMSWGSDLLRDAAFDEGVHSRATTALAHAHIVQSDCGAVTALLRDHYAFHGPIVQFPWGVEPPGTPGESGALNEHTHALRAEHSWGDAVVVLSVRSWADVYDIPTVVAAFDRARRTAPRLRLALAGDGPLRGDILRLVEASPYRDDIVLLGQLDTAALWKWYSASDIYLSCSLSDGSSVSLLEAMACGLPAVISDLAGNREWLGTGGGMLVPRGDVHGFAAALKLLADSARTRTDMGARNRSVTKERADWHHNIERLRLALERLIA